MTEQSHNGSGDSIPLPSATELILSTNLRVWVYPMNSTDFIRVMDDFEKLHPAPDKTAYERPVPPEDASFEGQMLSGESNPDYIAALNVRARARKQYIIRSYLLGYVDYPDTSEEELIARYARVIKHKRRAMTLPEDAWEATVMHALITEPEDQQMIVNVIERKMPLSEGEVTDQVRIFRPVHRGESNGKLPERDSQPSGVEA